MYLALARSLRHGGYNELYHVGTPLHAQYPPGYPAFLAGWSSIFGTSFDALVLPGILASAVSIYLIYRVLARFFDPSLTLASLAVVALNPYLVQRAGLIRAEPLFMLLSAVTLVVLARRRPSTRPLVVAGLSAVAAALTRSVGVTLILALGLHWLLERRVKAFLTLGLGSAVTVGAWLVWTVKAPVKAVGQSYIADATVRPEGGPAFPVVLAMRAVRNLQDYLTRGLPWRMPFPSVPGTPVDNLLILAVVVVGLTVGLWLLWRRWRLAAIYLLGYGSLLLVWPWPIGRFLLPLLPLVIPVVLLGLGAAIRRLRPSWASPVVLAVAALLLFTATSRTSALVGYAAVCDRSHYPFPPSATCMSPDRVSFFRAVAFIRDSLPEDATFLAVKSEPLWYYTGRRSVLYPSALSTSPEGFVPYLRSQGVGWILLGSLGLGEVTRMAERLEANCRELRLVAPFPPRTYLFRLAPPGAPEGSDGGGAACRAMAEYRASNVGRDFGTDPDGPDGPMNLPDTPSGAISSDTRPSQEG